MKKILLQDLLGAGFFSKNNKENIAHQQAIDLS